MKPTTRDMKAAEKAMTGLNEDDVGILAVAKAIANERARCARVCRMRRDEWAVDAKNLNLPTHSRQLATDKAFEAKDCADAIIASGGKP